MSNFKKEGEKKTSENRIENSKKWNKANRSNIGINVDKYYKEAYVEACNDLGIQQSEPIKDVVAKTIEKAGITKEELNKRREVWLKELGRIH